MNELALLVVFPLLGAFLLPAIATISPFISRYAGPFILFTVLILAASAYNTVALSPAAIHLGGFMAPLGIVFYIDPFSMMMAVIIALMFLLVWPWKADTPVRLHSLYLLMAASSMGLVISGDLFNLYVFYELLAVSSYGVIAIQSSRSAPAASLRFVFLSAAGSVLFLTGIAIIYTLTGTLNLAHLSMLAQGQLNNFAAYAALLLMIAGVGVKAELYPVNSWVAEVYASISKPLAALFAGLMSKLAVIVILRLIWMMQPDAQFLHLLLILGMLGVLSGELVAWKANDMTRILSFSSIAQLGLVFIALSIPSENGVFLAVLLMLHHWLVKSGLFLLITQLHADPTRLKGLAQASPYMALTFLIFILSLLGVPPFPGFWVKLQLVMGLSEMQQSIYYLALGVVLTATVIEAAYLMRLIKQMYSPQPAAMPLPLQTVNSQQRIAQFFALILVVSMLFFNPVNQQIKQVAAMISDKVLVIKTVYPRYYDSHHHLQQQASLDKQLSSVFEEQRL